MLRAFGERKGRFAWLLGVTVAMSSFPGEGAAQDRRAAQLKAASCNACHGPSGRSDAGIPPLAGRPEVELYEMLKAFKSGARPAFVMHQHAKGYSDEELRQIAAEFARQTASGRGQP